MSCLAAHQTEDELCSFFGTYGRVLRVKVHRKVMKRQVHHFGFVVFADSAAAADAIRAGHPTWKLQRVRIDKAATHALDPMSIRFTHFTISFCFRNGNELDMVIQDILDGALSLEALPPMEVVMHNEVHYSLSNRRLFVARVLATLGKLSEVKVRILDFDDERVQGLRDGISKWERSFTTENNGLCVFPRLPCAICRDDHMSAFLDKQAGSNFNFDRAFSSMSRQALTRMFIGMPARRGRKTIKEKELLSMMRLLGAGGLFRDPYSMPFEAEEQDADDLLDEWDDPYLGLFGGLYSQHAFGGAGISARLLVEGSRVRVKEGGCSISKAKPGEEGVLVDYDRAAGTCIVRRLSDGNCMQISASKLELAEDKTTVPHSAECGPRWTWSEHGDEVQVLFAIEPPAEKKELRVKFEASGLKVELRGEAILDGKTFGKLEVEDCTWVLADGGTELQVMLTKKVEEPWGVLLISGR